MFSRFRNDQGGFIFVGGIVSIVILVIYVLAIPWFNAHHAARTHHHHGRGDIVDGFLQGFYIVVGIIEHFITNPHIAVYQGPTMTLGYLIAYIVGVIAFLAVVAGLRG